MTTGRVYSATPGSVGPLGVSSLQEPKIQQQQQQRKQWSPVFVFLSRVAASSLAPLTRSGRPASGQISMLRLTTLTAALSAQTIPICPLENSPTQHLPWQFNRACVKYCNFQLVSEKKKKKWKERKAVLIFGALGDAV